QLTLLRNIASYYPEMPFQAERSPTLRYYFENDYYSYSDAICLYGMLRHVKPRHIIEVGSGFSSAVMLDTNERFLGGELACTFIDPYPDRLLSLMRPTDHAMTQLLRRRLQDVDLGVFDALET